MSVQFVENTGPKFDYSSFASKANEIDIGGVDDIVDLGDDLGINLLTNPKVAPSPRVGGGDRQVSFSSGGGGGGEMPQFELKPVDVGDVINLDAAPGSNDIQINRASDPPPFVINTGDMSSGDEIASSGSQSRLSSEDEYKLKQRLLTKLGRLEKEGIKSSKRLTMANTLEEIKLEHDTLTDSQGLESSIEFQRNALMTFVSGVEMLSGKYGHRLPVKPRLKGWSESVHTNLNQYDPIFEELYDLYKDKANVHPLMRLVGLLGMSGAMYHLTNNMVERAEIPGMNEILSENPEIRQKLAEAAMAKMGMMGNFMQAAGGFQAGPPTPTRQMPESGRSPFNVSSAAPYEAPPTARREMRGPNGVDDIIKAFEMERAMKQAPPPPPIQEVHASVFAPSGPPPSPPRGVSILREGLGSVDPLAEFMNSDNNSIGTTSTMNTERRRGRRRAVATPVGATLNLNV